MPTTILLGQLPQESVLQGLQILESSLASGDMAAKKFLGPWAWGLLARCREAGQMASEEIGVLRDLGKRAVWLLRGLRAGTDYLTQEQGQDVSGSSDIGPDDRGEETESHVRDSPRRDQEHEGLETTPSNPPADNTFAEAEAIQIPKPIPAIANQPDGDDPLAAAKASLLSSLAPRAQATTPSPSLAQAPTQLSITNGHSASSETTSAGGQPETDEPRGQALRLYATLDMIITIVGEFYGQRDLLEGRLVWGEIDLGNS